MELKPQHRKATGLRRAKDYAPVAKDPVRFAEYPAQSKTISAAIHDVSYYQGVLSNAEDFRARTEVDVVELVGGKATKRVVAGKRQCADFIQSMVTPVAQQNSATFRAIFCTMERVAKTSFGCRISIARPDLVRLMERLQMSPQFLCSLLGEPDYWSPGDFASNDGDGSLHSIEYFCQQPRWHLHTQDMPLSIYMCHTIPQRSTTYVVASNAQHARLSEMQRRLMDALGGLGADDLGDPFMFHALVAHETFLDAREVITPLRYRLYDQLDALDKYSAKSARERDKGDLEDMTIQFHVISQEIDSMTASADMTGMILRRLTAAHHRYWQSLKAREPTNAATRTADALAYLAESLESQRRWLLSYKSRRDIAMNLVFNLVTQQDAATSASIARAARADGNSMKVIAALTMIFLPATFLSSVFGMSVVEGGAKWWLYVALALPLTILVIATWWFWLSFPRLLFWWKGRSEVRAKDQGSESEV